MVEGLVDKKIKVDRVQPGLGCLCLSIILIGASDANLSDPRTRGGRGNSRDGRYIRHGDSDWQWVFLWQEKTRGKARPFVKDVGVKLSLQYHSSNDTTWTGDTHVETNILPSSKWQRYCWRSSSYDKRFQTSTTLMVKSDRHKSTLIDEEWDKEVLDKMRLDCYAHMWRSSLRLDVQDDMVFILPQSVHRPSHRTCWNFVEEWVSGEWDDESSS